MIRKLVKAAPFIALTLFIAALIILLAANSPRNDGSFPDLHITAAPKDITREEWLDVRISLTNSSWLNDFRNVGGRIRGRGNSTWHSLGEKQPYRISFDAPRRMFESDYTATDWVLLANAMDYSLLRNYSAYSLGRELMDFAPSGHFVHLYLNDDYRGVYLLTDQIEASRLGLAFNPEPHLSEYLIEWDNRTRPDRHGNFDFFIRGGVHFAIRYPPRADLTHAHIIHAQEIVYDTDTLLRRGNHKALSGVIDIPSFIDYYIIQELFRNADVGASSLFFHIRQTELGPKLFAGPIWDFDFSSGAGLPPDIDPSEYQPYGEWAASRNRWFWLLFETEWFRPLVLSRWLEIRDTQVAEMVKNIRRTAEASQAEFERNFERWEHKLGQNIWRISPTVVSIPDYMGNAEFLANWLERRIEWMNTFLY